LNTISDFIKLSGINQKNWLNPLLIGILPAIIIIVLLPLKFNPFLFTAKESSDFIIWFDDINDDGEKEKFLLKPNTSNKGAILYYDDRGFLIDQLNFKNQIVSSYDKKIPYSVDFDNDGVKEIVVLTQNNDSLFLNVFNYEKRKIDIDNLFVSKIGGHNNYRDYYYYFIGHYDTNHDLSPELFFSVSGGLALSPRRIFRFDYKNRSIISSINTGAGNLMGTIFTNNDSISIIVSGAAYGNIHSDFPFPYHDSTSWLFNFDENLQLKTKPIAHGKYPGYLGQILQKDSFAYFVYSSNNEKSKLYKLNWKGEEIDSIIVDQKPGSKIKHIYFKNNDLYSFTVMNGEEFYFLDTNNFSLYQKRKFKFKNRLDFRAEVDLDNDGSFEFFFYNMLKHEIIVYNNLMHNPIKLSDLKDVDFITANNYPELKYGELILNTRSNSIIYQYTKNPLIYFKYPIWIIIYFVSVLFVSSILYFQNKRINKQQELEQQLANLQLQNLRNQLDPHFTFNVLNTIGSYIYKQDKEMAYDLFQRFTRIIRSSLSVSDKVFWSLKEELQFTQDYLEFQKLRFKERFDYTITIDKNIEPDKIRFPKMLIQGFAENAVKHAFFGVDYTGKIGIKISFDDISQNKFKVVIEDNGIGINKSRELKQTSGTQKGLEILEEQVEQINKLHNLNYKITIIDNSEINPSLTGTRVSIIIPFH